MRLQGIGMAYGQTGFGRRFFNCKLDEWVMWHGLMDG